VRKALYRARFVLTGKLMPMIDLLIVDEAHKLKNPGSLRTQAMKNAFARGSARRCSSPQRPSSSTWRSFVRSSPFSRVQRTPHEP